VDKFKVYIAHIHILFLYKVKACFAESLEDSLEPTLKALEKQLPEKKKAVFGEQLKVLPKLMEELIESNAASLKKLQLMVEEKIFSIPKDVVLPGDIPQVNYDQKDAGKVENDIQKLMARYEAVRINIQNIAKQKFYLLIT